MIPLDDHVLGSPACHDEHATGTQHAHNEHDAYRASTSGTMELAPGLQRATRRRRPTASFTRKSGGQTAISLQTGRTTGRGALAGHVEPPRRIILSG